jgi:[protein-PII] uridylyltransferase
MSLAVSIIARRETLAEAVEALADRYWNNEPIEDLVSGLTQTFDSLIIDLWQQHFNEISGCALFAVGGYGRAELHPGSDIDILVLAEKPQRHREGH